MLMKSSIITGGLAIIAGSDTTSSAMSNFFYYLLTNPKTYKRVQDEIDELGDEVMNFGMQTQLSYLTAAMYVPHYSTPEFPAVILGFFLETKHFVSFLPYSAEASVQLR